mgnify:CR=1 FL=1
MVRPGQVMENPVAGDRLIFTKTTRETGGESLEFEIFAWAGASGTPEMVHTLQDESFEVLSGSLDLLVAGHERRLKAGESLIVPKGTPHRWWNGSDEEAHVLIELRPALRMEEFLANWYGLCNDKGSLPNPLQMAVLINEHLNEGHLTKPPLFVQKVLFGALAVVGRLLGYKAHYPKYSG